MIFLMCARCYVWRRNAGEGTVETVKKSLKEFVLWFFRTCTQEYGNHDEPLKIEIKCVSGVHAIAKLDFKN